VPPTAVKQENLHFFLLLFFVHLPFWTLLAQLVEDCLSTQVPEPRVVVGGGGLALFAVLAAIAAAKIPPPTVLLLVEGCRHDVVTPAQVPSYC